MKKTVPIEEQPSGTSSKVWGRLQTFQALQYRDFRLLWIGLIVSSVGTWMQIIAQSLLVLKITHGSALALGIVSLAQATSFFLFSLPGGYIADRIDKRRLLLCTQSMSMLLAFLYAFLTYVGVIQVWMIVLLAFCSGTILSFDQPTRSALVPVLVPRANLMNAISLQSIIFNGASVFGPALAGVTIGLIGYAGNFFLNGVSYLGVLVALYVMRVPEEAAKQSMERRGSLFSSVRAALGAVRRDVALPWILSGYAALLFFGPSSSLILPVFATQILHLSAFQLGLLFAAAGIGTVVGALTIASLGDFKYKGALLLVSFFLWVGALFLFGISRYFWFSIFALFLFGMSQNGVGATTITLMQTRVAPQMRGRVMSLNTLLVMGVRPLGDFAAGGLITLVGAPPTVIISASIVGLYTLFLLLARPAVRTLT
ncbi:MAG TPA: MFS transporter [Ktedonobacteraceae bacterium]|nr:MFS transporter [Ktedonobacteraceae bacterium]